MNDLRGSFWRKWDLHLHTPASTEDYRNQSVSNQGIIDTLFRNEIAAVAITDHHFMDVQRIQDLQQIGKGKITVFPGIEVRTDVSGRENVHLIGIFPENSDLDLIWTEVQSLGLHPHTVKEKGYDKIYVNFEDFCDKVHKHSGVVTIHAGKKSASIENVTNSLPHTQALKRDLLKFYDIFEMGKVSDIRDYEENVLPNIHKRPPMIICSDNHDITKYEVKSWCWIKADPTFEGLRQIIREPKKRVFVGEIPPVLERVSSNPSKYIRTFHINRRPESDLDEIWFDKISIDLNPEMVAIIGNKGNGKSALSDSIGLVGNSKNSKYFSFLNENKFCKKRARSKAKNFAARIEWMSGDHTQDIPLHNTPDETDVETVKYIPQQFFEQLCNEEDESFEREIKRVIFSQLEDTHGKQNLDELVTFLSEPEITHTHTLKARLSQLNEEIVSLEELTQKQVREDISKRIQEKQRELKGIQDPEPVEKPDEDSPETKGLLQQIDELNKQIAKLNKLRQQKETRRTTVRADRTILRKVKNSIDDFQAQYELFLGQLQKNLNGIQAGTFKASEIVELKINDKELTQLQKELDEELTQLGEELNPDIKDSLASTLPAIEKQLQLLQVKLDEPNKGYQEYLGKKAKADEARAKLMGTEDKPDTIKSLEKQLSYLKKDLFDDIATKYEERLEIAGQIFSRKKRLKKIREELFQPISKYIADNEDLNEEYPITLDVSFKMVQFGEQFFKMINQSAVGTFRGKEQGEEHLKSIIELLDISDKQSFKQFLTTIIEHLKGDMRKGKVKKEVFIHSQIIANVVDFYDFLFSLDYLEPYYELKLDNKSLSELSPGERGYLLIVFYLFIDKDDTPLIIDQPEENLDNQSVFELLVPSIQKVKTSRQLIIVTLNPNIAVVCDAEQVIHTRIDKAKKCEVTYSCGAIENPVINERIVEVLEGTLPAFDIRDAKYDTTRLELGVTRS